MRNGTPVVATLQRDMAVTMRLVDPVLKELKKGGRVEVRSLCKAVGADGADVLRALYVLEESGLVRALSFEVTPDGMKAETS